MQARDHPGGPMDSRQAAFAGMAELCIKLGAPRRDVDQVLRTIQHSLTENADEFRAVAYL